MGRNPKSGDAVPLRGKYVPHFKPGKELRERVNDDNDNNNNNNNNNADDANVHTQDLTKLDNDHTADE